MRLSIYGDPYVSDVPEGSLLQVNDLRVKAQGDPSLHLNINVKELS